MYLDSKVSRGNQKRRSIHKVLLYRAWIRRINQSTRVTLRSKLVWVDPPSLIIQPYIKVRFWTQSLSKVSSEKRCKRSAKTSTSISQYLLLNWFSPIKTYKICYLWIRKLFHILQENFPGYFRKIICLTCVCLFNGISVSWCLVDSSCFTDCTGRRTTAGASTGVTKSTCMFIMRRNNGI